MLATTLQPVVRVVSAHHGVCPTSSNRIYSERAANLFSTPVKAAEYLGVGHTEAQLLRDGGRDSGNSTIFITFDKIRAVRFVGWPIVLRVRTFGAQWMVPNGTVALNPLRSTSQRRPFRSRRLRRDPTPRPLVPRTCTTQASQFPAIRCS
jgi:hypothetical protein